MLDALVDRLVPADDDAGALEAGAVDYILEHCRADDGAQQLLAAGLAHLDRIARSHHGSGFVELPTIEQEALLTQLEQEPPEAASAGFFESILALTMEGFYCAPESGGNRGAASWTMLGYDPRRPGAQKRP